MSEYQEEIKSVNKYTIYPILLHVMCERMDTQELEQQSTATGFLYKKNSKTYLITNWHVVSGKNFQTKDYLDKQRSCSPVRLNFSPRRHWPDGRSETMEQISLNLYDEQKNPCWLEHSKFKSNVDVVAIPLLICSNIELETIDKAPDTPDLPVSVADDVFVIGYPYGKQGNAETYTPIWKKATIATELCENYFCDGRPSFLIDTATRQGMSGSPVVCYSRFRWEMIENTPKYNSNVGKFLGVYSGRIDGYAKDDSFLGLVWKKEAIDEIIENGTRGTND